MRMKKRACLKVQKGCSARPSKPAKCLTSDEWTLGDNDHGTIFHYLSNDYQTPSYLPTLTTFVLVSGWLGQAMVLPAGQRGFGIGRWEAPGQLLALGLHCQSVTGPIEFFYLGFTTWLLGLRRGYPFSNPCMAS